MVIHFKKHPGVNQYRKTPLIHIPGLCCVRVSLWYSNDTIGVKRCGSTYPHALKSTYVPMARVRFNEPRGKVKGLVENIFGYCCRNRIAIDFRLGELGEKHVVEKDLVKNREFVDARRDKLLSEYLGKFLLVHNEEVVGSYDTYEKAAAEGVDSFGVNGQFLVQQMLQTKPVNFVMEAIL